MMYVPVIFRMFKDEVEGFTSRPELNWRHVIMIDYAYHHLDPDYNGGLSLFDRLAQKLGYYHPEWNIPNIKLQIINACYPIEMYMSVVANILEDIDIIRYYNL